MREMDKKLQVAVLPLDARVAALAQLGQVMRAVGASRTWQGHALGLNKEEYIHLDELVQRAQNVNGWATEENVRHAMHAWGETLTAEAISGWVGAYPALEKTDGNAATVGLILPEISPGSLHDVICVW